MGYIKYYRSVFSLGIGGQIHLSKIQNFIVRQPLPSSASLHDSIEYISFALEILDILNKISILPKEH
jgi:hypothetical protein